MLGLVPDPKFAGRDLALIFGFLVVPILLLVLFVIYANHQAVKADGELRKQLNGHDIVAIARPYDFIRHGDGRLAVVEPDSNSDVLGLYDCKERSELWWDLRDLIQERAVLIPKSAPNYKDVAAECINR